MARFEFSEWILSWMGQAARLEFDWDAGNCRKSVNKHGVEPWEAEEAFQLGPVALLGRQVWPLQTENRFGVIGRTAAGRVLHMVFTLRGARIRIISSRPASRKERSIYEEGLRDEIEGV